MRLILAGTGFIGGVHAEAVAGRAEIVAAADIDPVALAAFAEKYSIPRTYERYEDALAAEDADAVVLCTPPLVHKSQAIAALERGLTVLCEKPPTLCLADFDDILAAEQASSGYFATVFQQRYGGGSAQLRALVASGELGRPVTAVCNTLWLRSPRYFAAPWRGRWESEGGGPTMGHGIHQMDLLLSILGPWHQVTAVAARMAQPTNTEDVSAAIVTFESGAVATVLNTLLAPRQTSYLRFDLEHLTAELEHYDRYGDANWSITAAPGYEEQAARAWAAGQPGPASTHATLWDAVFSALEAGEAPPATSESARATLELSAAIYASAFSGRPVGRGEIGPQSPHYARMAGEGAPWPPVK